MRYTNLGRTGLQASVIGLGCGNFGGIGSSPEFAGKGESVEEAFAIMDVEGWAIPRSARWRAAGSPANTSRHLTAAERDELTALFQGC